MNGVTEVLWPLVAFFGLLLAHHVALRVVGRKRDALATKADVEAAKEFVNTWGRKLAEESHTIALEVRKLKDFELAQLKERTDKLDARFPSIPTDNDVRFPMGLARRR